MPKQIAKSICPPLLWRALKRLLAVSEDDEASPPGGPPEYEYAPEGWRTKNGDAPVRGWNVHDVQDAQLQRWESFRDHLRDGGPLGLSPESPTDVRTDPFQQNIIMNFAYALTLASRFRNSLSILDWGGGLGHYYLLAKALVPDLELRYTCRDLTGVVEAARPLLPEARLTDRDDCLDAQYDLVFASGSLQYLEDWRSLLDRLVTATGDYLYIARLPTLLQSPTYVYLQRAHRYGYNTEYLGWALARSDLLAVIGNTPLRLVREFVQGSMCAISGAPETPCVRGYLFRRASP